MGMTIQQGSQLDFGEAGSPFGARTSTGTVATAVPVVLGVGWWLVETDANIIVRFTYDSGSNHVTVVPASDSRMVYSDGYNVEFYSGAGTGVGHYSQLLGV